MAVLKTITFTDVLEHLCLVDIIVDNIAFLFVISRTPILRNVSQ